MPNYFQTKALRGQQTHRAAQLPPPRRPVLDSRTATPGANKIFVALRGPRFDGHDFVQEAYRRGIRQFLVDRPLPTTLAGANVWRVENTLDALQAWAAHHRRGLDLRLVAITGSNGKTIVKEWTAQLIGTDLRLYRSPKSYNSQVGVALSLLEIEPHHEVALIETGISRPGEGDRLRRMLDADIGVLTNIGAAHDEGFASRQQKRDEKWRILRDCHTIFSSAAEVREMLGKRYFREKQLFFWHSEAESPTPGVVTGRTVAIHQREPAAFRFPLPFTDAASVENGIHAYLLAHFLGISAPTLRRRTAALRPVPMRLAVRRARFNSWLLDDSYSADLSSLRIALAFFRQQNTAPATTLILSDLLETGLPTETRYRQLAELIGTPPPHRVIGIGEEVARLRAFLPPTVEQHYYPDTATALARFDWTTLRDTGILLKGARRFTFERIAERLRARQHRTELDIDLAALRHNLHYFRQRLRPDTQLLVMVKAAAYGGGGLEVARLLATQRVDYLGVAYTDEGIALRRGGIDLPILVLNPAPESYPDLLRYRLTPELYSPETLADFARFVRRGRQSATVQLKLDTGMHRLGFSADQLPRALITLKAYPELRVAGIFSHLVGSETPAHDGFTQRQVALFEAGYDRLAAGLGYRPPRHLLNTAGMLRHPAQQYEMVRLGIGLYGIDPTAANHGLLPVFHLRTTVAQVREVAAGATVGYDRRGTITQATRIATLRIGYADGLPRAAGNGRFALLLRGNACPIVGNVCMDMCMVDVSAVPDAAAGDTVTVFGEAPRIEALAAAAGTIPYEILTGIGGRVPRVYSEG